MAASPMIRLFKNTSAPVETFLPHKRNLSNPYDRSSAEGKTTLSLAKPGEGR